MVIAKLRSDAAVIKQVPIQFAVTVFFICHMRRTKHDKEI